MDNNLGYQVNNCVTCCEQCNRAKGSLNKDEFFAWIEQIHNNMRKITREIF